jgi:long-chain acyl-CoA synthetase
VQLSDIETSPNLVALFLSRADFGRQALPLRPHPWCMESISWAEAARRVVLLAQNLVQLGFRPATACWCRENRPEWCIADLAIMAAGCITVPAYTTNTERDHTHVLENSGARGVIVSSAKLAKPLLPAVLRSGHASHVIAMEPLGMAQAGGLELTIGIAAGGDAAAARAAVNERMARVRAPTPPASSIPAAPAAPRAG